MSEVTFSGAAILVVGGLLGALAGTIAALFKLLMSTKDSQVEEAKAQRDIYKAISDRAIARLEEAVNAQRQAEGKAAMVPLAPVVAEHQSPTTPAQQEIADAATQRARLVAAELAMNAKPTETTVSEDAAQLAHDAATLAEDVAKLETPPEKPAEPAP